MLGRDTDPAARISVMELSQEFRLAHVGVGDRVKEEICRGPGRGLTSVCRSDGLCSRETCQVPISGSSGGTEETFSFRVFCVDEDWMCHARRMEPPQSACHARGGPVVPVCLWYCV